METVYHVEAKIIIDALTKKFGTEVPPDLSLTCLNSFDTHEQLIENYVPTKPVRESKNNHQKVSKDNLRSQAAVIIKNLASSETCETLSELDDDALWKRIEAAIKSPHSSTAKSDITPIRRRKGERVDWRKKNVRKYVVWRIADLLYLNSDEAIHTKKKRRGKRTGTMS